MFVGSMSATMGSTVTAELICRSFSAAATAFGRPACRVGLVEQRLPLKIAQFDEIAVDDSHRSHAGADQYVGDRAAQRAAAADHRPRLRQTPLALLAQRRKAHLAGVAGEIGG